MLPPGKPIIYDYVGVEHVHLAFPRIVLGDARPRVVGFLPVTAGACASSRPDLRLTLTHSGQSRAGAETVTPRFRLAFVQGTVDYCEEGPRETIPEQSVVAERQLPTLKELLPEPTWSSSSARNDAPVSLNTRDPVYVTYFTKIKQLIESQWEYPELALRYGLQGRLALEFTIGGNGRLDQLRLIRSSGSQLLDEEALRAIKAAAPFPPIPSWIKPNPLSISASMEYHDNRLNYRFTR